MTLETTNHQPPAMVRDFVPAAAQDTDSWVNVMVHVVRLAQEVAPTDFVPKGLRGNVPATAAAMLYGREVGLPPMTALTSIHVVDGRPGMSAEAMRSLVFAAGHEMVFDSASGASCRMRARRRGSDQWTTLEWSIDMARAAGLLHRDNWKKYPRDMLIARCTTALCRMVFPDVIHGFRSTEELGDMDDAPTGAPTPATATKKVQRRPRPAVTPQPLSGATSAPTRDDSGFAAPDIPTDAAPPLGGTSDSAAADGAVDPPSPDPAPSAPTDDEPPPPDDAPPDDGITKAALRMLRKQMRDLGLYQLPDDERHSVLSELAGRGVESSADLTRDESARVITALSVTSNLDEVYALLNAVREGRALPTSDDYAAYDHPTDG